MNKFPPWYDCIEPEVREIVYHLRNAGFNTTGSCGHEMWVEIDLHWDHLEDLYNILSEKWGQFYIEFYWEGCELWRQFATVKLGTRNPIH